MVVSGNLERWSSEQMLALSSPLAVVSGYVYF